MVCCRILFLMKFGINLKMDQIGLTKEKEVSVMAMERLYRSKIGHRKTF